MKSESSIDEIGKEAKKLLDVYLKDKSETNKKAIESFISENARNIPIMLSSFLYHAINGTNITYTNANLEDLQFVK